MGACEGIESGQRSSTMSEKKNTLSQAAEMARVHKQTRTKGGTKRHIQVVVDDPTWEALAKLSIDRRTSMADLLRDAIRGLISRQAA